MIVNFESRIAIEEIRDGAIKLGPDGAYTSESIVTLCNVILALMQQVDICLTGIPITWNTKDVN